MDVGQITATISRLSLQFKDLNEVKGRQIFVKCTFSGSAARIFRTKGTTTATGHLLDDSEASSTQESKPIDIPEADVTTNCQSTPKTGEEDTITVDVDLNIYSAKYNVSTENMSKLGATEMSIEVCLRGSSGDGSPVTTLGKATAQIEDVLRGHNEWSETFVLGAYDHRRTPEPEGCDYEIKHTGGQTSIDKDFISETTSVNHSPLDGECGVENSKHYKTISKDSSSGPLRYGGSTSTIHMTLSTDDDTADYVVGGGFMWVEEAMIAGVPHAWKLEPPPETTPSSWDTMIADMLAGKDFSPSTHVPTTVRRVIVRPSARG